MKRIKKRLLKIQNKYNTKSITAKEYTNQINQMCDRYGTDYICDLLFEILCEEL